MFREALNYDLKIRLWTTTVQAAAVYALEAMHVTKALLLEARAWEYKWLRKVFWSPRHDSESSEAHAKRFARFISSIFNKSGAPGSTREF